MKPWEKFKTQEQAPVQGKPWERFRETEQPKMSMGEEYRSRGEEYFINNTSSKYLPFISDKKLQENIRNVSSDPQGKAAFTTATNPLGFGDEIKAGIAAGVAKLFGGAATQNIDIGDLYREARISERAILDKARQDRPLTSFAGQMFSDVGIAGKALGAAGLAEQGFKAAFKGGALLGGTSALGETEDLTNIPQTLEDVSTGAVVGGVVSGAAQQAIPYVASKVKQGTSYVKNLFTKDTAEEVGAKALDPESAKLALKELMDKPSDKPLTAVDIQNPEFKTFARSVVSKYPQAREIVKDFTEGRNTQAFARINDDLKIISKVDNADDYTKQISDTQKSIASPLYDEAEADRTIVPKFEFKEVKTTTSPQTFTISEGVKSFKTDSSTKTKTDFINKYNLQSKSRDIEKPLVSKEEKELFKQAKGSYEGANKETAEPLSKDKIRLYRGLEQKFNKDFPLDRTDAPYGYSTWTDNPELARQYAGEKGYVYYKDLSKKYLGKEAINTEGDRVLFFDNQKPAGLNNIGGKEYLVYNEHELYDPNLIKEFKTGSSKEISKEELFNIADRYKTATQDLKKYAPKSPLQAIKELGGIADDQGELAAMGITNKTLPGLLRKEGTKGVGIDDVGEKLYEAGYFKERPTVSEVLDFIDKELRNTTKGNRAITFSQDSTKYNEAKQFLDEADSLGINIDAINKLRKITPQTSKTGTAGIKAGSSYDKRDLAKKGIEEFQNTLRKQVTKVEEGGKIVNVRKEITNLNQMTPKSIELAKQFDELENSKIYSKFKIEAKKTLDDDIPEDSIAMLHKIRKRIDADIARQYDSFGKAIDKDTIADNTKLRNKINNLIGEVSPTFKEADNVFRPLAIKKDAVEFGKEFSKYEPSEIIKKINEFTSKSGLKRQDILDDVKVGAKDTIVKDVEQLIKFDSSNIPTEIQVKKIIENKFKRDQLKTFLGEKDYNEFVDNINKEALFNKVSKSLGLNKPSTQEESTNFILRAFNGLISYATSNYGKYAAITNATKAGEQFLVKNYRGLNPENAKEIAKIITNKNASIKYLENIINKASKQQKPFVSQAVTDLKQLDKFSGIIAANNLDFGVDDANAEEPNLSEEQIRQQMLDSNQQDMRQGLPPVYTEEDLQNNPSKIKKRYYR